MLLLTISIHRVQWHFCPDLFLSSILFKTKAPAFASQTRPKKVRKREACRVRFSNCRTSLHQYQVVWRKLPTAFDELPKIYGMKLWA
ncbi:hypothetical protein Pyn_08277 [Prunus yedoensis var. nudiflora]|uniref:Uncharacterized protein n=1 Tax=Prunus yedoensis var. nudiflora TaxID=2094558 RepID=A0A314Z1Y6_PRUYE|nr:hypothetical protein Pyn_08277 [Prunus yedoensis var. nudiflora]